MKMVKVMNLLQNDYDDKTDGHVKHLKNEPDENHNNDEKSEWWNWEAG